MQTSVSFILTSLDRKFPQKISILADFVHLGQREDIEIQKDQ